MLARPLKTARWGGWFVKRARGKWICHRSRKLFTASWRPQPTLAQSIDHLSLTTTAPTMNKHTTIGRLCDVEAGVPIVVAWAANPPRQSARGLPRPGGSQGARDFLGGHRERSGRAGTTRVSMKRCKSD